MSGSSFHYRWDSHHTAPTTIITEIENPEGGDSAWFVNVRGDEFSILLTPDDAESLAKRLTHRVDQIRSGQVPDSPRRVIGWSKAE